MSELVSMFVSYNCRLRQVFTSATYGSMYFRTGPCGPTSTVRGTAVRKYGGALYISSYDYQIRSTEYIHTYVTTKASAR